MITRLKIDGFRETDLASGLTTTDLTSPETVADWSKTRSELFRAKGTKKERRALRPFLVEVMQSVYPVITPHSIDLQYFGPRNPFFLIVMPRAVISRSTAHLLPGDIGGITTIYKIAGTLTEIENKPPIAKRIVELNSRFLRLNN